MNIQIRKYSKEDKSRIIDIFNSNVPGYFESTDINDLREFLERYAGKNFYVAEHKGEVIGCCGFYSKDDLKISGMAWAMFKRYSLGLRKFKIASDLFFHYLLTEIKQQNKNYDIIINTTQHLERYFKKYGFITDKITPKGFGKTLDHYVMRMKMQ